jgi:murein L,D-transpeptidase YafK
LGEHPSSLPTAIRSKVEKARLKLDEAEYLLDQGDSQSAVDRAREAYEVAGGARKEIEELLARFEDPDNLARWRSWVKEAREESRRTGSRALIVDKFQHRALVFHGEELERSYEIEMGHKGLYPKLMAGDGATPEGTYRVVRKKEGRLTSYHKALLLDYPNESDRQRFLRAKQQGRIPEQAQPGGLIEIHGEGGRGTDWTDGCVAVSNHDMDALFEELSVGSRVTIVGRYLEERAPDGG